MKPVVIILGMHRSGTSCLTGSLQQSGLYLGEVYTENPYNRKGNRENQRIMELNNALLARNGGEWCHPPATMEWDECHEVERDSIIAMFNASGSIRWGFKDPRVLFTFPFWKAGFVEIQMVGTFRHPISVAKSLNYRNQMPMEEGLELWYAYNRKLMTLLSEYSFPLISFDVPISQYQTSIEFVTKYLGLPGQTFTDENSFFDDGLRTHNVSSEVDLPQHVDTLYADLTYYYKTWLAK